VGRFLEHSRIFYFRNAGQEEIYLGSADLMPRNLNRRVEVDFPVRDPGMVHKESRSQFRQQRKSVG
jgi:polyphosphate kinase